MTVSVTQQPGRRPQLRSPVISAEDEAPSPDAPPGSAGAPQGRRCAYREPLIRCDLSESALAHG